MQPVDATPSGASRRLHWAAIAALGALAVFCTGAIFWRRAQHGEGFPSYDIYAAHYPNLIYLLRSLKSGHGLLWNNLQNCGQPFIPSTLLGIFYPLNVLFLILDLDIGFLTITAIHLAIAGAGTYWLCRELGLSKVAALCGAICFELAGNTVDLAAWLPTTILGPYVWIPAALACCERILRTPSGRAGIALSVVLTLQVLPGYPQIVFFTYGFIALRIVWAFATRSVNAPTRTVATFAVALTLPILLSAAALFPMLEMARESIRSAALTRDEMAGGGYIPWQTFRTQLGQRLPGYSMTFAVIPAALAGGACLARRGRSIALFYLFAAALCFALCFENPLFEIYSRLPIARSFRGPMRLLWMTGFSISVIVAYSVDTFLAAGSAARASKRWLLLTPFAGAAAFWAFSPSGIFPWEWLGLALVIAACVAAVRFEHGVWIARVLFPALLAVNLFLVNRQPFCNTLRNGMRELTRDHAAFDLVKARITPQDRMYLFGKHPDYALMPKTPSVFGIPSVTDYEPQTSRRYAELFVMMMDDTAMGSINQYLYRFNNVPRDRTLFDLLATRFVVVDLAGGQNLEAAMQPPLDVLWKQGTLRVYENPEALPRAFYVPRIDVVPNPADLLARLASPQHHPEQLALVEHAPADGFMGSAAGGSGTVLLVNDRAEEVTVVVRASAAGFLTLTDQDYPGWTATVSGHATPILRANYAFRTVRVPAGRSEVVFRYRPASVWMGLLVSAASSILVLAYLIAYRPNSRRRASLFVQSS